MDKKVEQVDTFPPKEDTIETAYTDDQIKEALRDLFYSDAIYRRETELIENPEPWSSDDGSEDKKIILDFNLPDQTIEADEEITTFSDIRERLGMPKYDGLGHDDKRGWVGCDAMTDQTIKADAGKPKISMVPREAVEAIAKIFMYGETKYPKNSWRDVPVERYSDAGLRHWFKYAEDPHGMDLESGWPHCWHMLWNAAAVVAKEEPYFRERLGIIDWDD